MNITEIADKQAPVIVGKGRDHWNIMVRLTFDELLNSEGLLLRLHEVKKYLADTEGIPIKLLNYDGIIKRRQVDDHMDVTVKIVRVSVEKGEPVIRFLEKVGMDGTPYSDMKALIDLYPLDSVDQMITLKKVLIAIRQAGIAEDLVNPWFIKQKLRQVGGNMMSIKDIPIAIGSLPEIGKDAVVEFFFPAQPSPENSSEYYSSRKVKSGDLVCRKKPPQHGKTPGCNVKGKEIPPRKGLDIELKPRKGVSLSLDKLQATADNEGMVVIKWVEEEKKLPQGKKIIPTMVILKVNPVMKIDGNTTVDIVTSDAVEIEGNLKIGSRIVTDGEVHVSGSVEEGSIIRSSDDISVQGDVTKAEMSSEMNIIADGEVTDSIIVAKQDVIIGGKATRTRMVGKNISAKRISGCDITAEKSLITDRLDDDESEVVSNIAVGVQEFLKTRLEENQKFLEVATLNLERVACIIKESFVNKLNTSNVQRQWVKFCAKAHRENREYTRIQLTNLKTLFYNVPTLKMMISEKEEENNKIEQRMGDDHENDTMIVVREKVGKNQVVTVNGQTKKLEVSENGSRIENSTNT